MEVLLHQNTFLDFDHIGDILYPYSKTYSYDGDYVDSAHRYYAECPLVESKLIEKKTLCGDIISGWLRREDALKLYELAYFSTGNILELGTYQGLSTTVQAEAIKNSPHISDSKKILSVEINPEYSSLAEENILKSGLEQFVEFCVNDSLTAIKKIINSDKKFSFVFVDHSHTYDDILAESPFYSEILEPGGFILFHDYNDARNRYPEYDYGVYSAVESVLPKHFFTFAGIFGCTGLYQYNP